MKPNKVRKKIPEAYKAEFLVGIGMENVRRSMSTSVVIIIAELLILWFLGDADGQITQVSWGLVIACLIYLPCVFVLYKNSARVHPLVFKWIQLLYAAGMLFAGCMMSVTGQDVLASINTYVIAQFAVAAFLIMPQVESAAMYAAVCVAFCILLPYYQANPDIVTILRINAIFMNLLAWMLSRMVFWGNLVSFSDKKTIESKNKALRELSLRDSMTMLLNHKYSFKRLREELERARRIEYPLSIQMIDIDDFKRVNDEFGHLAGDAVIVGIARILTETCRATDVIGRYGGEEFLIIMPDTPLADAVSLFERIAQAVRNTLFENGVHITVSCGVSQFQDESAQALIKKADTALYQAKANGKNRVEAYENVVSRHR